MALPSISASRCLILGCSKRKDETSTPIPAIERYDGPPFQVLRRYLAENPVAGDPRVLVLSAKHGLIEGNKSIDRYDQEMTTTRAEALNHQTIIDLQEMISGRGYKEIFISMGKNYLLALSGFENYLDPEVRVIIAAGGSGKKLSELHTWLWGQGVAKSKSRVAREVRRVLAPQTICLRGKSITTTTDEATKVLVEALEKDQRDARRIRNWYIPLGGEQVSPKWAVQILFQLPVSRFGADEARRVLAQLGIPCIPI